MFICKKCGYILDNDSAFCPVCDSTFYLKKYFVYKPGNILFWNKNGLVTNSVLIVMSFDY